MSEARAKRYAWEDGDLTFYKDVSPPGFREWDESKHPRDPAGSSTGGQFTGGDGDEGEREHPGKGYSKDAWVDAKGTIHTSNVYDAQRALFEDRKVELKQPKQVSTLIHELAKTVNKYREAGKQVPLIDLCNVSVEGTNLFCAETKGIPRVEMPQMNTKTTKKFVEYLKGKGYDVDKRRERAAHLRATQNQLSAEKVIINLERHKDEPERLEKRLVVSRDNYILDGHHHWAAKLALDAEDNKLHDDTKMRVSRVDIDIITLLDEAEKFTGGKGKKPATEKDWDESKHPRDPAGTSTGGQFTGGSGGEREGGTYTGSQLELWPGLFPPPKGPKKKTEYGDFGKDHIELENIEGLTSEKTKKFLDLWNERVDEAPGDFRDQFLGGLKGTMRVRFDETDNSLELAGSLLNDAGSKIGSYDRTIYFDTNAASSDYFALTPGQTGGGIGKRMLAANVAMYQKLGLDHVNVHANIDVGGYAWAKYGYVPTDSSWSDLQNNLLENIGGGGGYTPESWDELSSDQQDDIFEAWKRDTEADFATDAENLWREDGGDLYAAKVELADSFDGKDTEWAWKGLLGYAITVGEGDDVKGVLLAPFLIDKGTSLEHVLDNTTAYYNDTRSDGSADPDFTIDEAATPELTNDERHQIEEVLIEVFNKEAEKKRGDMDPPNLSDIVADYQNDAWENMRDRDKFTWAHDNDKLPEAEGGESTLSGASSDEIEDLRNLVEDGDPKAIWAIADGDYGKDLLLHTDWNGTLDLHDKETMDRFNAYVGKEKPKG